ncbi:hypothetical protein LI90_98 [Carbonactinospora thermoautotrophica]|uniref:Uncharacterized protein n=1 Tax=Carbonactinospora thermoautotrophica TaxID=1469144 RepID=A0A132MKS8_9ACTN|nr:hypothetical protein LI90_98 [Carbonactinospora thermoautotrophica]
MRELAELPTGYRTDQGVYLARLARAYALSGEAEEAANAAQRALAIAGATGSRRIAQELAPAVQALSRWTGLPQVAEIRQGMTALAHVVKLPQTGRAETDLRSRLEAWIT